MKKYSPENESVEFAIYLQDEKRIAQTSLETYLKYYRLLIKMYPNRETLDNDQIKKFIVKHKNNFAVRGFTKAYLQYRELDKDITLPNRPTGHIKQRIIRNITPEEIKKIKDFLYKKDYQSGLIFDIITQGALRLSEIIKVKINSFNWKEWQNETSKMGRLHIQGKGNKERNILIDPDTMNDILIHITNQSPYAEADVILNQEKPLFSNIYPTKVYNLVKKASKEVIGLDIRPHELRHARSNNLLKDGNSIIDIKNLLGHSSISTTEIYLHRTENESLDNIEKNIMKKKEL